MIIELNLTNLLFIIFALLGGFFTIIRVVVHQFQKSLDTRFEALAETLASEQKVTRELERSFLLMQADIPKIYLRRDDYLREVQALQNAIQRDIEPIRASLTRIEDYLLKKSG
ncbi:MAG: hypothetical protein ACKVOO_12580 [Burkholderiaceae bacterium]